MKNQYIKTIGLWLSFCLLISSTFTSCKRGTDDPWFSWQTRNQRLTGTWLLSTYNLDEVKDVEIFTDFNIIQCDTSDVAGYTSEKTSRLDEYADSLLSSSITVSQGSEGDSKAYEIEMDYELTIDKAGTYRCFGNYLYFDDADGTTVGGNFWSETNTWYWEASTKTKWALTFINFPMIDVTGISENGAPIVFSAVQTFDVLKLSKDELQWDYQNDEHIRIDRTFEAYFVELDTVTTLDNCVKHISIQDNFDAISNWNFSKKGDE